MSDQKLLETQTVVSVDIDADACGFLKKDDDGEVIRKWQKCHSFAAAPRPIPLDILANFTAQTQWREDTEARIIYFGKAQNAVLTKFKLTEETPPQPGRFRIWTCVNVGDPVSDRARDAIRKRHGWFESIGST